MTQSGRPELIEALLNPDVYDHPAPSIDIVETHISWVILTGHHAYKIKKPVDLGFLDFTTLEKRRFFCHEEVRLNRRQAPDIYLGVAEIKGDPAAPRLAGSGPAIEYAVRMAEFPQDALMDRMLKRGEIDGAVIEQLSRRIADFHASVDVAGPESEFGTPERVWCPVDQNFVQIFRRTGARDDLERIESLRRWSGREFGAKRDAVAERKAGGFIRELHGDMHLGNMAMPGGGIVIFDCIEFNEYFRWIDTMSEIAFLVMDLDGHKRPDLASIALNGYLHHTGDYEGLDMLRYYLVYRALVRAKVARIRGSQEGIGGEEKIGADALFREYLALAERYTEPRHPSLVISHGLSGSGKTTVTRSLTQETGAIRIRSDVERKRLFGLKPDERSRSRLGAGLYTPEANRMTYERLAALAASVIEAGMPVIVDAAFLRRAGREGFRRLAARLGVPFAILDFTADENTIRERVAGREASGGDASEATLAVLEEQIRTREPLTDDELGHTVRIDTTKPVSVRSLKEILKTQPV